jgi:thiol-disulfide isomerase/thioredoxin
LIARWPLRATVAALMFSALSLASAKDAAVADFPSAEPFHTAILSDYEDKPVALSTYKGKPLVVNFWARWCGPCRAEIPELVKTRAQYKGRVEVLGLALEDKPEAVREFAKAYDIDYPVLLTKNKGIPLMQALGNAKAGLPFTLALNRQGKVVYLKLGAMKAADVEAAFAAAVK